MSNKPPQSVDTLYVQAEKLIEQRKWDEALNVLEAILDKSPNHGEAMALLAHVHVMLNYSLKSKEKVIKLYQNALNLNDKSPVTWTGMGNAHYFNEKYAEKYGAISASDGKPRLMVYHDVGLGPHLHMQIRPFPRREQ